LKRYEELRSKREEQESSVARQQQEVKNFLLFESSNPLADAELMSQDLNTLLADLKSLSLFLEATEQDHRRGLSSVQVELETSVSSLRDLPETLRHALIAVAGELQSSVELLARTTGDDLARISESASQASFTLLFP
jgi:hypothetical protein